MANSTYDIITVGGGLGGAALARAMAALGARVLVLEREKHFKDRVRGEFMAPWGVAEARELGIDQLLRGSCAHELPYAQTQIGSVPTERRDLRATTPQGVAVLSVYHPAMQEVLLQAAADAGAEVRRGAIARDIKREQIPIVLVEQDGRMEEVRARLVVGADGRGSFVRKWMGFVVQQDPERLLLSGVLLENLPTPQADTFYYIFNPTIGQGVPLVPEGNGRVRAYLVTTKATSPRLQGEADLPRFIRGVDS